MVGDGDVGDPAVVAAGTGVAGVDAEVVLLRLIGPILGSFKKGGSKTHKLGQQRGFSSENLSFVSS